MASSVVASMVSHNGTMTIVVKTDGSGSRPYVFAQDHPDYHQVRLALDNGDADAIVRLGDIPQTLTNFTEGQLEIKDGVVNYMNYEVHNTMTKRLIEAMRQGFKSLHFKKMLNFFKNMMENPDYAAVEEGYDFLDHKNLPITEDGYFLAYKRVNDDWMDYHTGKIDNSIGSTPEMPRNRVDNNRKKDCSNGLHVGTIEYVRSFHSGQGHIVLVKVNPRDIVSVPSEDTTKMRVCKYQVIEEYKEDLLDTLYTADAKPIDPNIDDDDDDDDDIEDNFEQDEFEELENEEEEEEEYAEDEDGRGATFFDDSVQ